MFFPYSPFLISSFKQCRHLAKCFVLPPSQGGHWVTATPGDAHLLHPCGAYSGVFLVELTPNRAPCRHKHGPHSDAPLQQHEGGCRVLAAMPGR